MTALVRQVGGGLGRGFWTLFSASFLANLSDGLVDLATSPMVTAWGRRPSDDGSSDQ